MRPGAREQARFCAELRNLCSGIWGVSGFASRLKLVMGYSTMIRSSQLFSLFLVTLVLTSWVRADFVWEWQNPKPFGADLNAIAYGESTFIAVGEGGYAYTSPDGAVWTPVELPQRLTLFDVFYAEGLFVAVGENGWVMTTSDGASWTAIKTEFNNDLYDVTYANGEWVAIGEARWLVTSPDAETWTQISTDNLPSGHFGIGFGNGTWVAVGYTGRIWTSTNKVDWVDASPEGENENMNDVTFANGVFVATANSGEVRYSTDAATWTTVALPTGAQVRWPIYRDGLWLVVTSGGEVYGSTNNGVSWEERGQPTNLRLRGLAWGAGKWIGVGSAGTVISSTDAQVWTLAQEAKLPFFEDVAIGGDTVLAVGGGQHAYSTDGRNWTFADNLMSRNLYSVSYVDGRWFAGANGYVQYTDDLTTWMEAEVPTNFNLRGVVLAFGQLWTAGGRGIYRSEDMGASWIEVGTPAEGTITDIHFDGTNLLVTDIAGMIHYSVDGTSWPNLTIEQGADLQTIADNGAGTWVITREDRRGWLYVSNNLQTWETVRLDGVEAVLWDVAFADGVWYVSGMDGFVATSEDLETWDIQPVPANYWLYGLAISGNWVGVVGQRGLIITSGPGIAPFADSTPIFAAPGWERDWYGDFARVVEFPGFFFTPAHGFQFHSEGSTSTGASFYDFEAEAWWWTSAQNYPALYVYEPGPGWVWFDQSTMAPNRVFIDLVSGAVYGADELSP